MQYCETLCCAGIVISNDKDTLCATCRRGKLNVVLDLDGTLIYGAHKWTSFKNCTPFASFDDLKIYKRPYVDAFLDVVFDRYNVFIWTAACKSYAKVVLANLLHSTKHIPKKVFTRKETMHIKERDCQLYACRNDNVITVKPLWKLKQGLSRIVIIDDTKSCFSRNISNGILIKEFDNPETQSDDCELKRMLSVLDILADFDDVRSCVIPYSEYLSSLDK